MPGHVWFELRDGGKTYCLVDPATRSWYRARQDAGGGTVVTQAGSRRLWNDVAAIHDRWQGAGRRTTASA